MQSLFLSLPNKGIYVAISADVYTFFMETLYFSFIRVIRIRQGERNVNMSISTFPSFFKTFTNLQ